MWPMRQTEIDAGRMRIRVDDHGGEGLPIVLLHGLASNASIWHLVAPTLASRFRVVAIDQRNHGGSSDAESFSFDELVSDVDAVVEALDLERPVVVGHSWGASVAMTYAASRACAAAIGVDGGMFSMRSRGATWEQTAERMRPPHIEGPAETILERMRSFATVIPWERSEPVVRRSFVIGEDGVMRRRLPIERHMLIVREMWEQSLEDVYAKVSCPVMLVLAAGAGTAQGAGRARESSAFADMKRDAAARLVEKFPDVRVEWLASVHDMPLLHPDELASLIASFLEG